MTMPEFKSEPERQKWITDNAEMFTVIRRQNRRNIRQEFNTLADAEHYAREVAVSNRDARLLIYAVYGVHDTYVKTVAS